MISSEALESRRIRSRVAVICGALIVVSSGDAAAQELEPRSYSNAPIDMNFLIAGYRYTTGGVSVDPDLPLDDAHMRTHGVLVGYARVLDFFGLSSKLSIALPYAWVSGSADDAGQSVSRSVSGIADPALKYSVNFLGAPALSAKEFSSYEQDVIVGATLTVSAPLGRYDDDKLLNIGAHRWAFKPELGISKALGPWTFELAPAVTTTPRTTTSWAVTRATRRRSSPPKAT